MIIRLAPAHAVIPFLCSAVAVGLAPAHAAAQAGAAEDELPRVVVLATGGTIASTYDEEIGALRAALTGDEIVEAVEGLSEIAEVSVEQIANVNSRDMTPEIWMRLSRRANALLERPEIRGVVVTHGTDTLEETAYFLDLTVTSDKPVVVVGAQRAPTMWDTDGPRNMLDAVRVAVSDEAVGMGTMVVMNGQINAAREVTKTNTLAVETFQTLDFGLLGVADLDAVRFYRAPTRRQTITIPAGAELADDVVIVAQYAGADARGLELQFEAGELDGVVVAGLGLAHVSSPTLEVLRRVRAAGIPVVVSSRVTTGRIVPLYANNIDLLDIGAVQADNLSPWKARVLLMAAMTHTNALDELRDYFQR
ncbi:MAG: asparaginase [Gemmatimonadetes bacterium]|nr:asparaginase [Gemmatimonadota bacterium]NNL29765.1 asparaginase [Gemmatimonadota bacterium]